MRLPRFLILFLSTIFLLSAPFAEAEERNFLQSLFDGNYSGQLHHAESHGLRQALKNCFSSSRRRRAIRREHRAREASRQASPGGFAIASVRWR